MRRREFIRFAGGAAAASSVAWPMAARAQMTTVRIGFLATGAAASANSAAQIDANFKTAKALGLEFPPALLTRADQVIEQRWYLLSNSGIGRHASL